MGIHDRARNREAEARADFVSLFRQAGPRVNHPDIVEVFLGNATTAIFDFNHKAAAAPTINADVDIISIGRELYRI